MWKDSSHHENKTVQRNKTNLIVLGKSSGNNFSELFEGKVFEVLRVRVLEKGELIEIQ